MKKLLLGTAAVIAFAAPAFAADLPARTYTKAPAYTAPEAVYNWTGFYIGGHVGGAFAGNSSLQGSDARFLGGEGPTDVLAFPLEEELPPAGRRPDQGGRGPGSPSDPGEPPALLGDVIVCPTVAGRQARERSRPADDEIALLVVHGVLHLLDYDHVEPDERTAMRRREQELLARFREVEREADGA